ncbi:MULTISPECIES: hypothetical protein [unclassified Rhizobium]|uniref:hypothetical protein n=1 Tax=unclassified Rhizobium TaxID=2613769 RepID=UPI001160B590|nr:MULTISPECIES: hypothetical protein [unclassified Rhizobium]TQX82852.1 hypothetical protein EQW76_27410 [Rhizobium sp. rho-13.1]TQY07020.1 hypothetical protein EQW74_25235 [Rhizobium sp. rho-1.1]
MPEDDRIKRSIARVRRALEKMVSSTEVDNQIESWEEFVSAWRTSINQITARLHRQGRHDEANQLDQFRRDDARLDYVWEARNAEEHTNEGTITFGVKIVERKLILRDGSFLTLRDGTPYTLRPATEEIIQLEAISVRRGGKRIVLPAPQMQIEDLASHALDYVLSMPN